MSDIFISYSRKDSEQALQLAERLQGEGMSVWIDQRGIEAAASWSKEIVDAIDNCRAFILLLSESSIGSANVAKEVGIAAESSKRILPIALQDVKLTSDLRYHLSGIQRVAYTQHDAITQALVGCGISTVKASNKADERKSLMILPFEDLSPTQDNGWFADGLVSEMIDKLSKIKSLKLVDRQTSLQIKKKGHTIAELAQILEVRYFIEGSIRKFGEQIKISSALLDFETGDHLWQDTHKGVFADIFEIQEAIADKVVAGLKLHLSSTEDRELKKKLTEHAEAYEFFLKGREEQSKHTRAGYELAIRLYTESVRIDLEFALGFANVAHSHLELYRMYDRNPAHVKTAEAAIAEVFRIAGESAIWCWIMGWMNFVKGDCIQAEHFVRLAIKQDPDFPPIYDALGYALQGQNRLRDAAEAQREHVRRRHDTGAYWSLLMILSELQDKSELALVALEAMPVYEKRLKLNPDDHNAAVNQALVLGYAGKLEEARTRACELADNTSLDALPLYNLACLFVKLGDTPKALSALRKSVGLGFSDIGTDIHDPDLDPLRELDEFKLIVSEVESRFAKEYAASQEVATS